MLFPARLLPGLSDGSVTVTFRRWRAPRARVGSQHRVPGGVIVVDAVDAVEPDEVTDADARRAGYGSQAELLAAVEDHAGDLYRVEFHWAGPDPREELSRRTEVTLEERDELLARLDRLDSASRHGPWTSEVLLLIGQFPGTRAADLAATMKLGGKQFKDHAAKLKELGLTESLEVGYRLSPRGRALLRHLPPE